MSTFTVALSSKLPNFTTATTIAQRSGSHGKTAWVRMAVLTLTMFQQAQWRGKISSVPVYPSISSLSTMASEVDFAGYNNHPLTVLKDFDSTTVFTREQMRRWKQAFMDAYSGTVLGTDAVLPYLMSWEHRFTPRHALRKRNRVLRGPSRMSPLSEAILSTVRLPALQDADEQHYDELFFIVDALAAVERNWSSHSPYVCSVTERDHAQHRRKHLYTVSNLRHMAHVELSTLVADGQLHPVEALLAITLSDSAQFGKVLETFRDKDRVALSTAVRVSMALSLRHGSLSGLSVTEMAETLDVGGVSEMSIGLLCSMVHNPEQEQPHELNTDYRGFRKFRDVPQWSLWGQTMDRDDFGYLLVGSV